MVLGSIRVFLYSAPCFIRTDYTGLCSCTDCTVRCLLVQVTIKRRISRVEAFYGPSYLHMFTRTRVKKGITCVHIFCINKLTGFHCSTTCIKTFTLCGDDCQYPLLNVEFYLHTCGRNPLVMTASTVFFVWHSKRDAGQKEAGAFGDNSSFLPARRKFPS